MEIPKSPVISHRQLLYGWRVFAYTDKSQLSSQQLHSTTLQMSVSRMGSFPLDYFFLETQSEFIQLDMPNSSQFNQILFQ